MTEGGPPLFTAVASSPRQLFHLLNTISFASRVQVRITSEGIRFAAAETGVLEAFIFLSRNLFVTYRLAPASDNDTSSSPPSISFSLLLGPLLSTLQILSSAAAPDVPSSPFAAHQLTRHAGAFSSSVLGTQGQCRLVYRAAGARLELSVPETGGVRTACGLATYLGAGDEAGWGAGRRDQDDDDGEGESNRDEIPFDRNSLRLKAILPSSALGDAVVDINALGPPDVLVIDASSTAPYLILRGEGGSGGECRVEFADESIAGGGRTKLLETFQCQSRVRARYNFGTVKKALVAMRAGTKVSLRIDGNGVLSLQFLVELSEGAAEEKGKDEVAFVDFRIVPQFEEDGGDSESSEHSDEEDD
ncbi:hypothetical protein ANO11243_088140 [Dothideomycetidae sp. 11243]|nr:hypothetical protein ANO11243_088140 [fungal sp. No.11243]